MPQCGELAKIACVAEVCAPKAGNVHPGAGFADVTWQDFVESAQAVAPVLDRATELGVGRTILDAVKVTKEAVGSNTNLGILLLLAPLCAVPVDEPLAQGVQRVLAATDQNDAQQIYEAIRIAQPGGLGHADKADVDQGAPDVGLVEAMKWAADRDDVAREYVTGFDDVLNVIALRLAQHYVDRQALVQAIVYVHLEQMARRADTLIARKCGQEVAAESSMRAATVLDTGWPDSSAGREAFVELDAWLRGDGNQRNPGTSADLICAGLFVALRQEMIEWPALWSGTFGGPIPGAVS